MPNVVTLHGDEAGEVVFYAHGSESLRTYLGLSRFHSRPDCSALMRGNHSKTVVRDKMRDVKPSMRCKVCSKQSATATRL